MKDAHLQLPKARGDVFTWVVTSQQMPKNKQTKVFNLRKLLIFEKLETKNVFFFAWLMTNTIIKTAGNSFSAVPLKCQHAGSPHSCGVWECMQLLSLSQNLYEQQPENERAHTHTHTFSVEPTYLHTSVSGLPLYSIKQDPGFDDKLLRLFTERFGNRGYWNTSNLRQAQETGNLHLIYSPLISTFPWTSMKRGGSPHTEHPPPASLISLTQLCLSQPHSFFKSLSFFHSSISPSLHHQLSPRSHPSTCLHPGLCSFIQLLWCWCLLFSGDMSRACVLQLCKVTDCPPSCSSGHMVLPKAKSELSARTHLQTGRAQSNHAVR